MRIQIFLGIVSLSLALSPLNAEAQTRSLASLSDAENTASILRRLLVMATSGQPIETRVFVPEVSEQSLDLILKELREAFNVMNTLPRYEKNALCEVWRDSDKSNMAVLEAMDAYDSARIEAGEIYAEPFVSAESDIESLLSDEDLQNFLAFMERWRTTYRTGGGSSSSYFSTAIRNDPARGKERIELQCEAHVFQ